MPQGRRRLGLTTFQRDVLIAHIDATVPVVIHRDPLPNCSNARDQWNASTRSLVTRGLLKYDRPVHPTYTAMTEQGRSVLWIMLEDHARAMTKAARRLDQIAALPTVADLPGLELFFSNH